MSSVRREAQIDALYRRGLRGQFDLDFANRRSGGAIGWHRLPVDANRFFGRRGQVLDVLGRHDDGRKLRHVSAIASLISFDDQRVCSCHVPGSLIPVCLNTARKVPGLTSSPSLPDTTVVRPSLFLNTRWSPEILT